MEAVAGYVRNIAFFIVFMAFVDIIAPSGGFRGYVRLVMSLILIGLVIEPVGRAVRGFGKGGDYDGLYAYAAPFASDMRRYDEEAADAVLSQYRQRLTVEITQALNGYGLTAVEVDVFLNEDYASEGFGQIIGLHVSAVMPKNGTVKRLLIGEAGGGATYGLDESQAAAQIKNYLSDFYNVQQSNIHITVTKDGEAE